ncbi:bacterial extracellular solute-binding proteins, family 5 Middle [Longilinea arvoryzae]|uniref:Bacterial extracellular solute-binding proteins, family 5 Middle n=1 Tax=Longilinea arvoryzae TaxID=360412 RepID=A0A0S7BCY8_9CHLR|nr:ABC transporter substrate-binding protein [Longilinea arvoryzae]GAP12291.1 bacterial extracellular solute-binding proteins, family 5 Middle [Longilinea arvoryzae]
MRKLMNVLGVLMVLSMVLTACATATPTATVVAPAATEAAPAATEAAPAATEAAPAEVSLNPYMGSNKLDGNGIPADFFQDVHIRKAFAYCFDWDTVINDVYKGEAVQSFTLPLPGMPGYDTEAPHYTLDLDKCAEEFKLADVNKNGVAAGDDTGDVWDMGFRVQMLYNTGNTTRQVMAEILQANLAAVNEKFVVEILGLPWPAYLAAQRAHKIPIMTAGWLEDIHDPHNWYQPYTVGTYGARQNMPDDMKAAFKDLLIKGVGLTDPAQRTEVYKQLNQLYYDDVPGIPLVLVTQHAYEQTWVEGRVMNPIFSNVYYKTISKTDAAKDPTSIVMATSGDTDTLDPALAYDTASGEIIQNVYEGLVFYDGAKPSEFVPQLAESWTTSDDGKVWTFKIRQGVKFHEGGDLTPSDVAYTLQRGLLQGGYSSPQLLLAEPFLGIGNDDITMIVDGGASADDRETLMKNDPAKLKAACETVQKAIVADDAAGTVTMTLAQAWGPFLATLANGWGSIMDKEWVMEKGGWDGTCDTWQNFYGMTSADDPFSAIANGTGPFKLDHWTPGQETVLTKFDGYWGDPAKVNTVSIKIIPEFGTRFAMFQAGDADIIYVPVENRPQVDPMVGVMQVYDPTTLSYGPDQTVCAYDSSKLGVEAFTPCKDGEKPTWDMAQHPFRLHIGQPGLQQDVILFNFNIE